MLKIIMEERIVNRSEGTYIESIMTVNEYQMVMSVLESRFPGYSLGMEVYMTQEEDNAEETFHVFIPYDTTNIMHSLKDILCIAQLTAMLNNRCIATENIGRVMLTDASMIRMHLEKESLVCSEMPEMEETEEDAEETYGHVLEYFYDGYKS